MVRFIVHGPMGEVAATLLGMWVKTGEEDDAIQVNF